MPNGSQRVYIRTKLISGDHSFGGWLRVFKDFAIVQNLLREEQKVGMGSFFSRLNDAATHLNETPFVGSAQ